MTFGLGECPVCEKPLAYGAKMCPHCGHPFDQYGSFEGYLVAMQVEEERKEEQEGILRKQRIGRFFTYLLIILLILAVIILLWLSVQHSSIGTTNAVKTGSIANGNSMIQIPSSTSQGEMTIQHYYDAVNSQNYPVAYYMWDKQGESLADFQSGYSNTKHDGLAFGDVVSQADGTVKVNVTIYATESTASGGTRLSTYKGYYIVGMRGNEWKILSGILNRS